MEFLLHVLYNTPETMGCKNTILEIIERNTKTDLQCVELKYSPEFIAGVKCVKLGTVTVIDYCAALEEINKLGCVTYPDDGNVIDPETGYAYDPLTGQPYNPVTGQPIDLGTEGAEISNPLELDCYNKFLSFIEFYKDRKERPDEYYELIKYLACLNLDCVKCERLPFTKIDRDKRCSVLFCDMTIPDLPEVVDEPEIKEPEFSDIDLGSGVDDTWVDEEPTATEIVANTTNQAKPIWWYHSDHLGSSSYITDILGKPVQYYEYLPFGEIMVQQSTNNIFENVYKFNGKELDESTGYYYYGARYYDPGASIFLSVDPLAEQFPGWNPYHYVHNNPINLIDPTGMAADGWRENKETGEKTFSKDYTKANTPKEFNYADEILSGSEGKYYDSSGGITDVGTVLPEIEMTKKSSLHPYYNAVPSGEYGAYNPDGTGLTVYGSFFGTSLSLSLVSDNSNRFALFTSYSAGFGYNTPNFKLLGFGATFDVYNNYGTESLFQGIEGTTMDYSAGYYWMGGRSIPLDPSGQTNVNGVYKTSIGLGKGINIGQSKTRQFKW